MNKVIDKLTEVRNMCVSQRDHIRFSERIAEKREQEYEKALQKAREADQIINQRLELEREMHKFKNALKIIKTEIASLRK
jgi:membrane-anchored protein YejM (alkaline phosphatase superfamily)